MKTKVRFNIYPPLLFLTGFLWSASLFYNKTQDYRQGRLEYQKLRTESVQQVKEVDRKIGRKMGIKIEDGENRELEKENGKEVEDTKRKVEEEIERTAEEKIEAKAEEETERKAENKTEAKAEEKTEEKAENKTEDKTEEATKGKAENKTEDKAENKTEDKAEEETEEKAENKIKAKAEEATERISQNEIVMEAEKKIKRKAEKEVVSKAKKKTEREAESKNRKDTKKEVKNKEDEQSSNEITSKIVTDVIENKMNLLPIKEETLKQYNPDYAFWLTIPDTPIDYPVVSSPSPDYYLNHTFQKQKNSSGCLFTQPSESEEVENVVIYGHNRKDGSMFGGLKKYGDSQFYDNHPRLWIYYKGRWYQGLIFSCQLKGQQDVTCYQTEFKDRQDKEEFIKNMKQRSLYPIPVYPASEDPIITLSTCYGSSKRMIVQAVLMCYTE